MHRVRVFLNGAASSSSAKDWRGEIGRALFRSHVEFVTAGGYEEFQSQLRAAARDKVDVVISVGGDGTFNTLLQELARTDTTFLVVPAGTANDLARELGITRRLRKAVECVRKDEWGRIDLLSVNGRYMATNGGIGIVSDVASSINEWRSRLPGFRSAMSLLRHHVYTLGLAGHLAAGRTRVYSLRLHSPAYSGEIRTRLLLVNNQPHLGGSFTVAPRTRNDDGTFNVTAFTHPTLSGFVQAVYRVRQGLPVDHDPFVLGFETESLLVESTDDSTALGFFGDGELLDRSPRLDIRIHPRTLRVFRPARAHVALPAESGAAVELNTL